MGLKIFFFEISPCLKPFLLYGSEDFYKFTNKNDLLAEGFQKKTFVVCVLMIKEALSLKIYSYSFSTR